MSFRKFAAIAATLFLTGAASLQAQRQLPLYLNPDEPVEARVKDALAHMTLEEKCRLAYAQSKFTSPGVPRLGIPELRYSDGPHGVRAEINWNNWGYAGWTSDSITAFPALTCLAATWNPELAGLYGRSVGEEARYRQKNVLLGPGVNIYRTPLGGRNFEYMGEDPYLASRMVVPYVQQLQSNGVAACVKHYALNEQEEYRGHVDVKVSDRAFYEIYLPPFRAAITEGKAWSVMGSYNRYNGQHASHHEILLGVRLKRELGFDGVVVSDWGATHSTREAALFGLDSEMGTHTNGLTSEAEGFGYDDYYLGRAYYEMCLRGEVPDDVINDKAGRILRLLFRTERSQNVEAPNGCVNTDEHLAVARQIGQEGIVLLKNDPFTTMPGRSSARVPLLPIRAELYRHILVVGENATRSLCMGGGSSELKARTEISPLEGLRDRFGADLIDYAQGYASGPAQYGGIEAIPAAVSDSLRADAVAKARQADLVIYIGGLNKNHFSDCEGGDRLSLNLDYGQDRLINELLDANPRMVCVIISGNAFAMPWLKRVPSLVQDWYVGSMAGRALADVLSGDVNPSGKTVFTYPASLEDCPAHQLGCIGYPGVDPSQMPADFRYGDRNPSSARLLAMVTKPNALRQARERLKGEQLHRNVSPDPRAHRGNGREQVIYFEDILVGYRWHDYHRQNGVGTRAVLFPFGYGLSYTQFEYSRPTIFGSTVSVSVTNTGKVSGKEVVQFYVGDDKCSVVRPPKELKHFVKVSLRAGETKTISYTVRDEDLRFYDETTHRWVLEPGLFTIYVGSSSADIRGKVTLVR